MANKTPLETRANDNERLSSSALNTLIGKGIVSYAQSFQNTSLPIKEIKLFGSREKVDFLYDSLLQKGGVLIDECNIQVTRAYGSGSGGIDEGVWSFDANRHFQLYLIGERGKR